MQQSGGAQLRCLWFSIEVLGAGSVDCGVCPLSKGSGTSLLEAVAKRDLVWTRNAEQYLLHDGSPKLSSGRKGLQEDVGLHLPRRESSRFPFLCCCSSGQKPVLQNGASANFTRSIEGSSTRYTLACRLEVVKRDGMIESLKVDDV